MSENRGLTITVMAIEGPSDIPSGYVKIAIENGHRNSEFSHEKNVIFHSYVSLPEGTTKGVQVRDMYWNGT